MKLRLEVEDFFLSERVTTLFFKLQMEQLDKTTQSLLEGKSMIVDIIEDGIDKAKDCG